MGYKVNKIYVGTNLVRPVWKPGSNTIAYYPLDSTNTVNDLSGNNRNLTNYNGVAFGTYAGVNCSYFSGNKMILYNSSFPARRYGDCTINVWMYTTSNNQQTVIAYGGSGGVTEINIKNGYIDPNITPVTLNNWHNIVYTINSNVLKMYVDGEEKFSGSHPVNGLASLGLGRRTYDDIQNYLGYMSEVIIENKVRTAQEVTDYYNQTKSNYGL